MDDDQTDLFAKAEIAAEIAVEIAAEIATITIPSAADAQPGCLHYQWSEAGYRQCCARTVNGVFCERHR